MIKLDDKTDMNRVAESAPDIIDRIQRITIKSELLFQADQGKFFAFFCTTGMTARMIRAEIEKLHTTRNSDGIFVFESNGKDLDATAGFTRVGAWYQHN